jgi:CRISPR-associated protein Csy1
MSAKQPINNLAGAIRLEKKGAIEAALSAYQQACRDQPQERDCWFGLARTCALTGNLSDACEALKQWLEQQSQDAEAWERLGRLYAVMHSYARAESCLRRALEIDPQRHDAKQTLLYTLKQLGLTEALVESANSILRQQPNHLPALVARALYLPPIYRDLAELRQYRRRYTEELNKLASRDPIQLAAHNDVAKLEWSNFYLAYQGEHDLVAQKTYSRFLQGILCASKIPQLSDDQRRARTTIEGQRIRVGFLSSFFQICTVGKYFSSWVTDLPRDRFDVHLYFTGPRPDALTNELARYCTCFRHLRSGVAATAQQLLDDQLDILIYPEVGMEGEVCLLANLRLAPIQMACWGHPVTTGSSTIDYYLSCTDMEPEDGPEHYSESLITLSGLGTRYVWPATAKNATRAQLRLPVDQHIYLVPQSLFKIHPDNDEIYMQILERDSKAVLVFFASHARPVLDAFIQRLLRALREREIDARSQIKFLPRLSWDQFLDVNAVADVMLDSLHWSGGQTSLDALGSDLPVVTLPGRFMRGRQTQAMLKIIGLPELIAQSTGHYVDVAIEVASNERYNSQLRTRIAEGKSKLFDQRQPIAELGRTLENLHVQIGNSGDSVLK